MKNLLRLEELAQFLLCLFLLSFSGAPWWMYVLLVLGPDIGMLGYLVNSKVGAYTYNVLHHKGIACLLLVPWPGTGWTVYPPLSAIWDAYAPVIPGFYAGVILFGHASMDRIFGYGLKFGDNFHHTHLGWIGKLKGKEEMR
jgi:hypothetical protein